MTHCRKLALAGASTIALAVGAGGPAGAITLVLTQTPGAAVTGGLDGAYTGQFDLSSYLHDAEGRTFEITAATLSAQAHSDPNYGAPHVTGQTIVVDTRPTLDGQGAPLIINDETRTTITDYEDTIADGLILEGGQQLGLQDTNGRVTGVIDTTDTQDLGFTDEAVPNMVFSTINHIDTIATTIHRALYGDLDLSFGVNDQNLFVLNYVGTYNFYLQTGIPSPDLPPPFPGFPSIPGVPTPDGSRFTLDSVTLSLDLTQTGGPPPGVPEPGAWTLMIAGFGLAGAALRRRRSLVVAR